MDQLFFLIIISQLPHFPLKQHNKGHSFHAYQLNLLDFVESKNQGEIQSFKFFHYQLQSEVPVGLGCFNCINNQHHFIKLLFQFH